MYKLGKTSQQATYKCYTDQQLRTSSDNYAFCRLCATKIPRNKLLDLRSDVVKYRDINTKLTRLNSPVDFNDEDLPTTVCYQCCASLQDAYEFVITVDRVKAVFTNHKQQNDDQGHTFEVDHIEDMFPTRCGDTDNVVDVLNIKSNCNIKPTPKQDIKIKDELDCKTVKHARTVLINHKQHNEQAERDQGAPYEFVSNVDVSTLAQHRDSAVKIIQQNDVTNNCNAKSTLLLNLDKQESNILKNLLVGKKVKIKYPALEPCDKHGRLGTSGTKNTDDSLFPSTKTTASKSSHFKYEGNGKLSPKFTISLANNKQSTAKELPFKDTKVTSTNSEVTVRIEPLKNINGHNSVLPLVSNQQQNTGIACPISIDSDEPKTWRDYEWRCSMCEAPFPTCGALIAHSMEEHNRCNTFKCLDCKKRTATLNNLVQHVKREHRDDLKLSCFKCFQPFNKQSDKSKHLTAHIHTPYRCRGCNTCFKNLEELDQHKRKFYRDLHTPFVEKLQQFEGNFTGLTCLICNKTLLRITCLYNHLSDHFAQPNTYVCDKCGKGFKRKRGILGHMLSHSNARPFQCDLCSTAFKTKGDLRIHIDRHNTEKKFCCDKCDKKFISLRHLKAHKQIHIDSAPVTCKLCGKSFRFLKYLNIHMRRHMGIKPYYCEACRRHFTNGSNYNKHMTTVHRKKSSKSNEMG